MPMTQVERMTIHVVNAAEWRQVRKEQRREERGPWWLYMIGCLMWGMVVLAAIPAGIMAALVALICVPPVWIWVKISEWHVSHRNR